MSIKDLFDKGHSLKSLREKSQDDLAKDVESPKYIDVYSTKRDRFIPDVDFTTASNFARFGSAELYYENSIKRIYQTYPYDGSLTEKIEWENESTYIDLFIFENEYPRTNGFVTFNSGSNTYTSTKESGIYSSSAPQYIFFTGGPQADPSGDYKSEFSAGPSHEGISKANIYHTDSQRTNNLEIDPVKGLTIEFWMKKDGWGPDDSIEYIFNISSSGSSGDTYGNLSINALKAVPTGLSFEIVSGSSNSNVSAAGLVTGITDGPEDGLADSKWHHYAITLKRHNANNVINFYVDGTRKSQHVDTTPVNAIDGTLIASIGALAGPRGKDSPTQGRGWGNVVSCSIDEFRYWKTERSAQQIGRYYRDQIGGGTNTDNVKYDDVSNKVDLGVYFKFNEGITGDAATDATILDYSGRISNGTFINYNTSESRNINSAIVLAGAAAKEFKDPIIHSNHPSVASLLNNKKISGSMHDHLNGSSIYKSIPGWIMEEDESESGHLKFLTQIIASYFDEIYLQIQSLPRLRDINYPYDTNYEKPLPFADYLLSSRGFDTPELFADASILAKYLERGEHKLFEKKLYEVKNTIYQNIYNNLSYIQKSKGTIKSLRNLMRCYGVDEELIKINIYAANDTYELKESVSNTSVKKKYLDFDDLETRFTSSGNTNYTSSYTATAYQYYDSSDSNSKSFIPGVLSSKASGSAITLEAEVIFPKRSLSGDKNYQMYPSLTASILGLDAVNDSNTDLTYFTDNTINFNIIAIKGNNDKRNVTFGLVADGASPILATLETGSFMETYDNEKWNLAFRLRPTKYPVANLTQGSTLPETSGYTYEFYGVNYLSNVLQNEFVLSGTISNADAEKFFTLPKRIYAGAKRENFTGSVTRNSDVKVSSVRFWFDYLDNETLRAHARDPSIYGTLHPYKNSNFAASHLELFDDFIPQIETLALNWTLDNVTGSNAEGKFLIEDFASGSASDKDISRYGWISDVSKFNYTGRGDFFTSGSQHADQVVDIEFVQSAKQKLPETVNSDDFVKILSQQDDVVFTRDTTYIQHHFSIEKSMYQIISEEMLRFFATIVDFNNLIGDPVNRYRPNYKRMEKLRDLFFEKVENQPDLDKFVEYYKWIDDAITMMISQLMPASSNSAELLRNMVESHILERSKYWTKFPTLETKVKEPISSLIGINELLYNWKFGHANTDLSEDKNCLWWKDRAERDVAPLKSSDANVDSNKNTLLKRITTEISSSGPTLKTISGTKYEGQTYVDRRIAKPVHLDKSISLKLKGGSNPKNNNIHDFYKGVIKWGSDDDFIWLDRDHEIKETVCNDKEIPDELNKEPYRVKAFTMTANEIDKSNAQGTGEADLRYSDAKSTLLLPFSMYSSSLDTGYITGHNDIMPIDFTNIHHDEYGPSPEVPMQGPFTEANVGGLQHRHVDLNRHDTLTNASNVNKLDGRLTRLEGWELKFSANTTGAYSYLDEDFDEAEQIPTDDFTILSLGDPGIQDNWRSGPDAGTDNSWTIIKGTTPSTNTGPNIGADDKFAFTEVSGGKTGGQTFGLITPLIDLLDVDNSATYNFYFDYHMHGNLGGMGTLQIQHSQDPTFQTGVTDITMTWDTTGTSFTASSITGQQHVNASDPYKRANVTSAAFPTLVGTRFYIRFLYTSGIGFDGDCAIKNVNFVIIIGNQEQDTIRLLDAAHDDHNRPRSIFTREEYAKRPLNIRNIRMTGSSPTKAGNFLDRYEYVSTVSAEANDPWFVKNSEKVVGTTANVLPGKYSNIHTIMKSSNTERLIVDNHSSNSDVINNIGSIKVENANIVTEYLDIHQKDTSVRYYFDWTNTQSTGTRLEIPGIGFATIVQIGASSSTPYTSGANVVAEELKKAIEHKNGHDGRILITRDDDTLFLSHLKVDKNDYELPDRSYISGSVKNRTRFKNRFSSPGGYEVMSRAFLDPAHETYSVYNAMPWRNNWGRKVLSTQLQAHQGQFGVSTHGKTTEFARVYGSETVGNINSADYQLIGDSAKHKHHRNNIERNEFSSSFPLGNSTAAHLDGNAYFKVSDDDSLSFRHGGFAGTAGTNTIEIKGFWDADTAGTKATGKISVNTWTFAADATTATTKETFVIPATLGDGTIAGAGSNNSYLDRNTITISDTNAKIIVLYLDAQSGSDANTSVNGFIVPTGASSPVQLTIGVHAGGGAYPVLTSKLLTERFMNAINTAYAAGYTLVNAFSISTPSDDDASRVLRLSRGIAGATGNCNTCIAAKSFPVNVGGEILYNLGVAQWFPGGVPFFSGGADAVESNLSLLLTGQYFILKDVAGNEVKFQFFLITTADTDPDDLPSTGTWTGDTTTSPPTVNIGFYKNDSSWQLAGRIRYAINAARVGIFSGIDIDVKAGDGNTGSTSSDGGLTPGDGTGGSNDYLAQLLNLTQDSVGASSNASWADIEVSDQLAGIAVGALDFNGGTNAVKEPQGLADEFFTLEDSAGKKAKFVFDPTASGNNATTPSSTESLHTIGTKDITTPSALLTSIKSQLTNAKNAGMIDISAGSILPIDPADTEGTGSQFCSLTQETVGASGNTAVLQDASNPNYVQVSSSFLYGSNTIAAGDRPFSISAWINMSDATTYPILSKYSHTDTAYEYKFLVNSSDKLEFAVYDGGTTVYEKVESNSAITDQEGSWVHVAATADLNGDNKAMKLYLNGSEVTSTRTDGAGTYVTMDNTSAPVLIGAQDTSTSDYPFQSAVQGTYATGGIDEVSLWATELNSSEITEIYQGGTFSGEVVEQVYGPGDLKSHSKYTDLISWWRMGDSPDRIAPAIVGPPPSGPDIISFSYDQKNSNHATGSSFYATQEPKPFDGPKPGEVTYIVTGSLFDNAYISHMIPRTDQQTRWITASLI